MMGKNKSGLLDQILQAKIDAQNALQGFGARIRKNIDQGQKDFAAGKIGNGAINPFK